MTAAAVSTASGGRAAGGGERLFWAMKRAFDILASLLLIPLVAAAALGLLVLNPWFNRGPLLFRQTRMGRGETEFVMLKFRTMAPAASVRGPWEPVERQRITRLGAWLRRLRIDELPQVFNVLAGEMSLIGPRPDYIGHARAFTGSVPLYRARHAVRPGISGYAQVRLGYAEDYAAVLSKAQADLFYIRNAGWRLELSILLATLVVVASGRGAR